MRIIFVTRKVDFADPRTGFVHTWISRFAKEAEELIVICLEKGEPRGLPDNVKVFSMGKEKGYSRFKILTEYRKLLRELLPDSDGVFIHMHPIYAITAWPTVKKYHKKMVMWYTHKSVDLKLRIAEKLVDKIFTASKESFRLPSKKVQIIGHGIDSERFQSSNLNHSNNRLAVVDRISPVKKIEVILEAMKILVNERKSNIRLDIFGSLVENQEKYRAKLDSLVEEYHLSSGSVGFSTAVDNKDLAREVYSATDMLVSASETGSIDKAMLEAAACECLVLTSNEACEQPLKKISPLLFFEKRNANDLADKIQKLLALPEEEKDRIRKELRAWVVREHNLDNLVKKIVGEFR